MTAVKTPSIKTLAQDIRNELSAISVYWPSAATELERVLNLGLPLAECIHSGLVHTVTPEGRSALSASLRDLITARRILADNPRLGDPEATMALWDAIYAHRFDTDHQIDASTPAGE